MTDSMSVRVGSGPMGHERALARAGLGPVAGCDEAGRGACAGPLVAAAVILDDRRSGRIAGLADSKTLSAAKREALFNVIMDKALAVCDRLGMQEADISGLRRAVVRLGVEPGYVLSDGFPVDGLTVPDLGMWKGDSVCACVAAASIVAKVARDRIMIAMDAEIPGYDFAVHKGYATALHQRRLKELGPSRQHRMSYANVRRAARLHSS